MESNGGWVALVNILFGLFMLVMKRKKDRIKDPNHIIIKTKYRP
jgi:hypothetical protein